jgi:hypothetical protein
LTSPLRHLAGRLRRRKPPAASDDAIRLHLGCGADYWDGYINVDSSATARCDLQLDFRQIAQRYAPGSIREIAMMHSLSYLRLWEARDFLADLYRLLEPGGRLVLELPDLAKCAKRALETDGARMADYLEAVRGLYAFDMEQIKRREPFTPYAFGWSAAHLRSELENIGFSAITVGEPQTHGRRVWRDTRIEATK